MGQYENRFNFRADDAQTALITEAADRSGEKLSDWLRTRTEAAAHAELAAHQDTTHTELGMQNLPSGACVHPRPARQWRGIDQWCVACNSRIGRVTA